MTVEIKNSEILIRFSAGFSPLRIQSILDYLKYEELTSKSKATKKDPDSLLRISKKGRFEKIKEETEIDD